MGDRLEEYAFICAYKYLREDGTHFFSKHRFERLDPIANIRSKTFAYWDPRERSRRKPSGADRYLYRLPELLRAVAAGAPVHWTEGEKDADALVRAGVAATSHHQGAGHVTLGQASWLVGARRVVLWVDLDQEHPEVGAYDAAVRGNLLVRAGVPAARLRFVAARSGKDAFDHLAAGYDPAEARRVPLAWIGSVAARFTPAAARRAGYRRG